MIVCNMSDIEGHILLFLSSCWFFTICSADCSGQTIVNPNITSLYSLMDCSLIHGSLRIVNLDNTCCQDPDCSLPRLTGIFGSLIIDYASCTSNLSSFLPNLSVVRGRFRATEQLLNQLTDFNDDGEMHTLIIRHSRLRGIGLHRLMHLGTASVLLVNNPLMCNVDTVDWASMQHTETSSYPVNTIPVRWIGFKPKCPDLCPSTCPRKLIGEMKKPLCWSPTTCQTLCSLNCLQHNLTCRVDDVTQCCHPECLGSCDANGPGACTACKHVHFQGQCLPQCPDGFYTLHQIGCLSRQDCIRFVDNSTGSSEPYAILGNECVPRCPVGQTRSPTGKCVLCMGVQCQRKACGNVQVYEAADLDTIRGCTSAQSVLISLSKCDGSIESDLINAFADLREIHRSLHIIRSDALTSLNFLRNLQVIHGIQDDRNGTTETVLEIAWNSQLKDLWRPQHAGLSGKPSRLLINSSLGRIAFTLNRNLCPDQVVRFGQEYLHLERALSSIELDLIGQSNGDAALCPDRLLQVTVSSVEQRAARISFQMPNWDDSRHVLPTKFRYRLRNDVTTGDENQEDICYLGWLIQEMSCSPALDLDHSETFVNCIITSLRPAMRYEGFVEIRQLTSTNGARSNRLLFTTYPDTPSPPSRVRATPTGSDRIHIEWFPPREQNGVISTYRIAFHALSDPVDLTHYGARQVCSTEAARQVSPTIPIEDVDRNDSLKVPQEPTTDIPHAETRSNSLSCTHCALQCEQVRDRTAAEIKHGLTNHLQGLSDEADRLEMVLFEDRLQNLLLFPRDTDLPNRFVREVQLFDSNIKEQTDIDNSNSQWIQVDYNPPESHSTFDTHPSSSTSNPSFGYTIHGLHHFTSYEITISACHTPHDLHGHPVNLSSSSSTTSAHQLVPWCSFPARLIQRTRSWAEADRIAHGSIQIRILVIDCDDTSTQSHRVEALCRGHMRTNRSTPPSASSSLLAHALPVVVEMRWRIPSDPNGVILFYWIRYRSVSPVTDVNNETPNWLLVCTPGLEDSTDNRPNTTSAAADGSSVGLALAQLSNLPTGTYEFQIQCVTSAGNGSWTHIQQFTIESEWQLRVVDFFTDHFYLLIGLSFILLVCCVLLIVFLVRRTSRLSAHDSKAAYSSTYGALFGDLSCEWEISPKHIQWNTDRPLGRGSFGIVYAGVLKRLTTPAAKTYGSLIQSHVTGTSVHHKNWRRFFLSHHASQVDVAVKTVAPGSSMDDIREFLSEAAFVKNFPCQHIVRMLGVVANKPFWCQPPALVMEYMVLGDLAGYLRRRLSGDDFAPGCVPPDLALSWSAQIADGMAYLGDEHFVHRDLAARNCLVDANLVVKIADFGLARFLDDAEYYRKRGRARLPIRWMSPEALDTAHFSVKSDVWSYGVVLWEIATFAALPYPGLSHEEVINHVVNGGHPDLDAWPVQLPSVLSRIAEQCWSFESQNRPSFKDILSQLDPMIDNELFRETSYFHSLLRSTQVVYS